MGIKLDHDVCTIMFKGAGFIGWGLAGALCITFVDAIVNAWVCQEAAKKSWEQKESLADFTVRFIKSRFQQVNGELKPLLISK